MTDTLAMPDLPFDEPPRTFRAATLEAALDEARHEMGDVELIEARRVRRGGLGGFFATDLGIEIVVVASSALDRGVADVVEMFPSPERDGAAEGAAAARPTPGRDDVTEPIRRARTAAVDPDATTMLRRPTAPMSDPDATTVLRRPQTSEPSGEVALDKLIAGATERDRQVAADSGVFRPAIAGVLDQMEAERAEAEAAAAIDAGPTHPFAAVLGAELSDSTTVEPLDRLSMDVRARKTEAPTPDEAPTPSTLAPILESLPDPITAPPVVNQETAVETSVFSSPSAKPAPLERSRDFAPPVPITSPPPPPPPPMSMALSAPAVPSAPAAAAEPQPSVEPSTDDTVPSGIAAVDRPTAEEAVPDDLLDSVFSLGSRGEGSFSRITLTVDRHDGNSVTVAADFAGDERG